MKYLEHLCDRVSYNQTNVDIETEEVEEVFARDDSGILFVRILL